MNDEVEDRNHSARCCGELEFYAKDNTRQMRVSRNLRDIVVAGPETMPDGEVNAPPGPPGRTVVCYTHIKRDYGKVFESGMNGTANLAGTPKFYMSGAAQMTGTVMASPWGILGTCYAAGTTGSGGKTNIWFSGKRWIPDSGKPQ